MTTFQSSLFSFKNKNFVAEISELPGNPFAEKMNGGENCDGEDVFGFSMVSEKTHMVAKFYHQSTMHDRDNDITHWNFSPTPETVLEFPGLEDVFVTILND